MKKLIKYSIYLILCCSLYTGAVFADDKAKWTEITLLETKDHIGLNASSALQSANNVLKGTYGAANLFDHDFSTAWVEGKEGDGIQEAVFFLLPEGKTRLNIMNGYAKSKALFKKNNRARSLKLSLYAGVNPEGYVSEIAIAYKSLPYPREYTINLSDTCAVQSFTVPLSWDEIDRFTKETLTTYAKDYTVPAADTAVIVKLEFLDVYRGSKWDDTCISEIFFEDVFIHNQLEEKYHTIDSVYVNDKENTILINSAQSQGIELYDDPASVLQIIDTSPDNQWLIIIRMSSDPSPRHQTEHLIFNTYLAEIMNHAIEQTSGETIFGPFLFNYIEKNLYLEYYTIESSKSKQILLK
ncbi:MAG: hypothetical protein R6V04_03605 [bacterium]